jgi:hypothetical protein
MVLCRLLVLCRCDGLEDEMVGFTSFGAGLWWLSWVAVDSVAVTRKGRVFVMGLLGWLEQGLLANGHGGGMGVKVTVFVGRMRSCVAVTGTAMDGGAAGENGGTAVFGRNQRWMVFISWQYLEENCIYVLQRRLRRILYFSFMTDSIILGIKIISSIH